MMPMKHCSGLPHKAKTLRHILQSPELSFLMEAHSGLSARIVEEAGFAGIWGSSLAISAQMCLRDCNEASWTQVCEVAEYMSDATTIPILLDADTGYGNFNNARLLVRKLEKLGVAGVCVEDKQFPKMNSLISEHSCHRASSSCLADADEFAQKIRAMKEAQSEPNFCVVARLESLVAQLPVEESVRRARGYARAGADAVLVHSTRSDASDIESFMLHWTCNTSVPVIVVPTTYPSVPVTHLRALGVRVVIWANYGLRASISAMQGVCRTLYETQSALSVESDIVPMHEVFRLQRMSELHEAELRYRSVKDSSNHEQLSVLTNTAVEKEDDETDSKHCTL